MNFSRALILYIKNRKHLGALSDDSSRCGCEGGHFFKVGLLRCERIQIYEKTLINVRRDATKIYRECPSQAFLNTLLKYLHFKYS